MSNNSISYRFNFACERIIDAISTETELNIKNNLQWPCSICNKNVTARMKGLQCDTCDKWCHLRCDHISEKEYEYQCTNNDESTWNCLYCTMKFNHEHFAFSLIDCSEIEKINNSDSMSFCSFLPSLERIAETEQFMAYDLKHEDEDTNDLEQSISTLLDTKYYSVNAFQKLNNQNSLNIFHS